MGQVVIDHTRGLCGKADVPDNTLRVDAENNLPHCLCCGSEMRLEDCTSASMDQLGMYWLICPTCPAQSSKEKEVAALPVDV